jgi:hypothetical protein
MNFLGRQLYDAPGHQFEPQESEQLSTVIELAFELGWGAVLAANSRRQLLLLSHGMEIYRGSEWRFLAKKLIALGYWRD